MSKFLQAIEPEKIQSVIDRMQKAGWTQANLNLALADDLILHLNSDGAERFFKAVDLFVVGCQAATEQKKRFTEEAARAAILPQVLSMEAELQPPVFSESEHAVLMELVFVFVTNRGRNGQVELTVPPQINP